MEKIIEQLSQINTGSGRAATIKVLAYAATAIAVAAFGVDLNLSVGG